MQKTHALSGILLAATLLSPGFAPAAEKAPPALQAEFTAFMTKFNAAVKANDAIAVAGLTKLPFMADPAIGTADQFRATVYKDSFSKKARDCIRRGPAVYDRDQEQNENFFIFCGDTIFVFTKTPEGFLFTDVGAND